MPIHPDFAKIKRAMIKKYGQKKGEDVYYGWLQKNGYDDSKPMKGQKSKSGAEADDSFLDLFDDPEELEQLEPDKLDKPSEGDASSKRPTFKIPSYKFNYVAEPKPSGTGGEILMKAIVLEQGLNVNGWRVDEAEFGKVGEQYKAGRQLRVNHGKDVQDVFGKSYNGKSVVGKEIAGFMGKEIEGINPDGLYVVAEFEALPTNPQIRTNILQGYVETGSIGLDANAYCDKCGEPIQMLDDGTIQRTCHDLNAGVVLKDVEVKEYSYVAEPAYPHSVALPSFAAAVAKSLGKGESSLSKSPINVSQEMSAPNVSPTASVTAAKKADAEGEGQEGQEGQDALAIYKMGYADAFKNALAMMGKFRADSDSDSDSKKAEGEAKADAEGEGKRAEATASAKTDQIGKVAQTATHTPAQTSKAELLDRVWYHPTEYMAKADPAIVELFTAAVKHPDAPPEVRARFRGMIK